MKSFFLISLIAFTGVYAEFPNQWKIKNKTKKAFSFECSTKTAGLTEPIKMKVKKVPAGGETIYKWSDWYYNDVMGLNPGNWKCLISGKKVKGNFSTDWGENITIEVSLEDKNYILNKK
jgi:hypothetical protein